MDKVCTLAATSFVRVFSFTHGSGRHLDPDEERFDHPELIFTLADAWGIRSCRGEAVGRPGTLVLGNEGECYRCRHFAAEPGDRTLGISFVGLTGPGKETLRDWLGSLGQPLFAATSLPIRGDLRWYLHRLQRETAAKQPGFLLKVDDLCQSMLVEVVRAQRPQERRPRHQMPAGRRAAEAVARVRSYIDDHIAEHLELLTMAHVAGVSPFYFSRLFKRELGCSPHQYVMRARLDRAALLLRNTGASVLDIALTVGFQDPTHFTRAFRRHTGGTPTRYRRGG